VTKSRRMREVRNAYKILIGKPEENIILGKPMRSMDDNIKMDP
jgi:hypothetical protein